MNPFVMRVGVRIAFYTACLFVTLLVNATMFDETEVTSILQFIGCAMLFEGGMAFLPEKFRGLLRFPREADPTEVLASVTRVVGVCALGVFAAVFLATTIGIRKEVAGLREAFLTGDVQTTWPDGPELRTVRTRKTAEGDWFERHVAAVREARSRPR